MELVTLREMATDALRYWEPRRLFYNALLAGIVVVCAVVNATDTSKFFDINKLLFLFVLAVLANVAYCAAYVVDLFLQFSHFREQRRFWRPAIAAVGFTFAGILTYFFAMGLSSGPTF